MAMRKGNSIEITAGTPNHLDAGRTAWLIANRKRWQAAQEANGLSAERSFDEA